MHRRAVDRAVVLPHGQEVRDRDRLAVRDQEAVEVPRLRRPGAHPRRAARLRQVDRALAPEVVLARVAGEMPLVRAPAELRRLAAFAHEAVHRPGVHELAGHLGLVGHLRVALGDMDDPDAKPRGELRPVLALLRVARLVAGGLRDIQQRLLDEVRHHPGIRAVRDDGRRAVAPALAQLEHFLAQRVVGASAGGDVRVGVAARPGLDAGVEVQRTLLMAQLDERDARHVYGQVKHEVAAADQRLEHVPVVLARERVVDELDAVLRRLVASRVIRGDDRDAVRGQPADVAQDQRQYALADAAEADEDQAAREMGMNRVLSHDCGDYRNPHMKKEPACAGSPTAKGESGGLERKRCRSAATPAHAFACNSAAPEFALGARHRRQGTLFVPRRVRRALRFHARNVHGG